MGAKPITDMNTDEIKALTPEDYKIFMADALIGMQKNIKEHEEKFTATPSKEHFMDTADGKNLHAKFMEDVRKVRDDFASLNTKMEERNKSFEETLAKFKPPMQGGEIKANVPEMFAKALRCRGIMQKNIPDPNVIDRFLPSEDEFKALNERCVHKNFVMNGPRNNGAAAYDMKSFSRQNFAGAGVLTTPPEVLRQIMDINKEVISDISSLARTLTTSAGELTIPTQTAHSQSGWVNEGETRVDLPEDEFGARSIVLHGQYASFRATGEMLQDPWFPFESFLVESLGKGLKKKFGTATVIGTGVGQPEGFMTDPRVLSTNSENADTVGDMLALNTMFFSQKGDYRASSKWGMNSLTQAALLSVTGGDGHSILKQIADSPTFRLLGLEVVTIEDMPDIAAGTYPIIIADWREFYTILRSVLGATQIRDPYTKKYTNQVEFVLNVMGGGAVVTPEAGRKYKIAVTTP